MIVVFLALCFVAFTGYFALYMSTLKDIIARQRITRTTVEPGSATEAEFLDLTHLEEATAELEALGFRHVGDNVTRHVTTQNQQSAPITDPFAPPPLKPERFKPQGFSRVFSHPTHGCVANLMFVATKDLQRSQVPQTKSLLAISSFTGRGGDDWSYATSKEKTLVTEKALRKLWRRPRALWTKLPDVTATQLLEEHLRRRIAVARAAGITWQSQVVLEDQLASEARAATKMQETFQRATPLKMAWQIFWFKRERESEPPEWLGELKGRLKS